MDFLTRLQTLPDDVARQSKPPEGYRNPAGELFTDAMYWKDIRGNILTPIRIDVSIKNLTREQAQQLFNEYVRLTGDTISFEDMMGETRKDKEKK